CGRSNLGDLYSPKNVWRYERQRRTAMKITDRFIGDHKTFRKLIRDINQIAGQSPSQWDQKRLVRLVELFKDPLVLHAWGEEIFYYSAVESRLLEKGPINKAYMIRLGEEHETVDNEIERLETQVKSKPVSNEWPKTYQRFVTGLVAHMDK